MNQQPIELHESLVIATGTGRTCYRHPHAPDKLIKVDIEGTVDERFQNDMEYRYYTYLRNRNISFEHLANCFGWVDTNKGRGLVFEYVKNHDGSNAPTLEEALKTGVITHQEEDQLLEQLKHYLLDNILLFTDSNYANILYQTLADGSAKLVIIDGIGPKNNGLKFRLRLALPWYAKSKVKKEWQHFIRVHQGSIRAQIKS